MTAMDLSCDEVLPKIRWSLADIPEFDNKKELKAWYDGAYIAFSSIIYTKTLTFIYKNASGDFDIEFSINKDKKCYEFNKLFKVIEFFTRDLVLTKDKFPNLTFKTLREIMLYCIYYFHDKSY